mgnify:FL=1
MTLEIDRVSNGFKMKVFNYDDDVSEPVEMVYQIYVEGSKEENTLFAFRELVQYMATELLIARNALGDFE